MQLEDWQSLKRYYANHLSLGDLSYAVTDQAESIRFKISGFDFDAHFMMKKDDPLGEEIMNFLLSHGAKPIEKDSP